MVVPLADIGLLTYAKVLMVKLAGQGAYILVRQRQFVIFDVFGADGAATA